jgi:hypothetical protein
VSQHRGTQITERGIRVWFPGEISPFAVYFISAYKEEPKGSKRHFIAESE